MNAPTSPGTTVGEVKVFALTAGEWLFRVEGVEEDDARYRERRSRRQLDREAFAAVTEALASGETRRLNTRWQGRLYRQTWSFDPPYYEDLVEPGERFLWFYPMLESRHVFRAPAIELTQALAAETRWLLDHVDHVERGAALTRDELAACLRAGLARLEEAARRGP